MGAIQAGAQFGLKVAHFGILGNLRLQQDKAARVVVDLGKGLVDTGNALFDRVPLHAQMSAEIGQLPNRVFFQQGMKTRFKLRQVIECQLVVQFAVFTSSFDGCADILGVQPVVHAESAHA